MAAPETGLRFGAFRLDVEQQRLWRRQQDAGGEGDAEVHLTPRAFAVLLHLAHAPGRLVTRDELFARHWPGVVVTEDALSRCVREIRTALGDDAQQPRHIVTVHRRGYRFVGEPPSSAPSPSTPPSLPPVGNVVPTGDDLFVGRLSVLARAQGHLEDALRAREGACMAFLGEPGIGKTRLAMELAAFAARQGVQVILARAVDGVGAPPLWPWEQVLRALQRAEARSAADPATAGADDAGALTREHARFALRAAVARRLHSAARERPLLLVLDDLHVADEDTLQVLLHIASEPLHDVPLLLLATWRDVGSAASDLPVAAVLQAVAEAFARSRRGLLETVRGFDLRETRAWLDAQRKVQGDAAAQRVRDATALHARSGGNPLYLRELLLHGHDDVPLAAAGAETLQLLLRRRVAAMPAPVRQVLEAAALLGMVFDVPLLRAVALADAATIDAALEAARDERLVAEVPDASAGTGSWCFTHGLVREALAAAIDTQVRRALHGRCAEALARRRQSGVMAVAHAQVALHFLAAEPTQAHHAQAAVHLAAAATEARAACAFADAARHGEMLLALLVDRGFLDRGLVDGGLADAGTLDRLALGAAALACGHDHAFAGDVARGRTLLHAALGHARAARAEPANAAAAEALLRAAVSGICELDPAYPPNDTLLPLLDEAFATLPVDAAGQPDDDAPPPLQAARAALLAQRSYQHMLRGESEAQDVAAEAALACALRARDERVLERAQSALCYTLRHPARATRWREVTDERIARALRRGDRLAEYDARRQRLEQLLRDGTGDEVARELERWRLAVQALGTPSARAALLRTDAGIAIATGRLEAAGELARQALSVGMTSSDPGTAMAVAALQFAALAGLGGRAAEALPQLDAASGMLARNSLFLAAGVFMRLQLGHVDAAYAALQQLSERQFADLPHDITHVTALANLAVSATQLGHRLAAEQLHALLLPWAGSNVTVMCYCSAGSTSGYLGRLATVLGRWDLARGHFALALEHGRRSGDVTNHAAVLAAFARCCRAEAAAHPDADGRDRVAALHAEASAHEAAARALCDRHGFTVGH